MPGAERRSPAPDRQQRDVDPPREVGHGVEDVGVAGEVDALGAVDGEADRLGDRAAERMPAAVVNGAQRGDRRTGHVDAFADGELDDVGEALAREDRRGAARDDDAHVAPEHAQRREVQMIEVQVGDQGRVDALGHLAPRARAVAAQVRQPRAQHRIGEQAGAADLQQHRRVAHPRDALAGRRHGAAAGCAAGGADARAGAPPRRGRARGPPRS